MDLARAFRDVFEIVRQAESDVDAWRVLIGYIERSVASRFPSLRQVDVASDLKDITAQLEALTMAEPYPTDIDAVYFGLFDAVSESGGEVIGFYIAGVRGFRPDNGDSLCGPVWLPDGRYLSSALLDQVKVEELNARKAENTEVASLLSYAGQLGTALMISKFLPARLFPGLTRVAGFDEGDFAEIAKAHNEGKPTD